MIIASDAPMQGADVTIETTSPAGAHERATLAFETWRRVPETKGVLIRCYDATGAAVNIFISQELAEELVFGETLHVCAP